MNYTKETKEYKQAWYGNYCQLCRKNNIEVLPYHSTIFEDYTALKWWNNLPSEMKSNFPQTVESKSITAYFDEPAGNLPSTEY